MLFKLLIMVSKKYYDNPSLIDEKIKQFINIYGNDKIKKEGVIVVSFKIYPVTINEGDISRLVKLKSKFARVIMSNCKDINFGIFGMFRKIIEKMGVKIFDNEVPDNLLDVV
jgi:hypothetical protein